MAARYDLNPTVEETNTYDLSRLVPQSSTGLMRPRDEELSQKVYGDAVTDNYREFSTTDYYGDQEQAEIEAGRELLENGSAPVDLVKLYQATKVQPKELVDRFSLEYEAGKKEANDILDIGGDISVYNSQIDKDFYKARANQRANREILTTMRDKAAAEFFDEPLMDIGLEMGSRLFAFVDQYKDAKVLDDETNPLEFPLARREMQKDIIFKASQELEPDQFQIFISMIDQGIAQREADGMSRASFWDDIATPVSGARDVFHAIDIAGVAGMAAGLIRGTKVSKDYTAVNKAREAIAMRKADDTVAVAEATPTALKADMVEGSVSEINNAAAELDLDIGAADKFLSKVIVDADAVDKDYSTNFEMFKESFKRDSKFSDRELKSIDIVAMDDNKASVTIGHGSRSNRPFVSETAAKKYADSHELTNYSIEQAGDGYKIVATYDIPDNIGADLETWKAAGKPWKQNFYNKWFGSRSTTPDNIFEADVTTHRALAYEREASRGLTKPVNDLNKDETATLDKLLRNETNSEKWLTEEQLRTAGVSDKVIEAHRSVKAINDIEYVVSNDNLKYALNKANIKNIHIDDVGNFYGKEVDTVKDLSAAGFKDLTDGTYYKPGKLTAEELKSFSDSGKSILKRMVPDDADGDNIITHYIVNPTTYKVDEIPQFPIKYVAGPRRFYKKGTLYLKTPRTTSGMNGPRLMLRPSVIAADVDNAAIKVMRDELNDVIKLWRDLKNGSIDKVYFSARVNDMTASNKYVNIADYKDFMDNWVKPYKLNSDFFVEAVEDGQELEQVKKLRLKGARDIGDGEDFPLNSLQEMLDDTGNHFNHRGAPLRTPTGDYTPTVSPQKMMEKQLNKLIYSHTTYHYNDLYKNHFVSMFSDVIKDNPNYKNMTSSEFLRSVEFIDEAANKRMRRKIQAGKNMIDHWRNLMFQRTDWDDFVSNYMTALADWLGEVVPRFARGSDTWEKIATFRPDKFVRSMAYQMYLGCFNIRQIWLQAIGITSLYSIEPLYAPRSFMRYAPLRMAMTTDDPAKLRAIAKINLRLGKDAVDEFVDDVAILKQINAYGPESVQVFTNSRDVMSTNSFRRASTAFVREGERFNFLQANDIALKKIKDTLGKTSKEIINDKRLMRKVVALGDDLYLNVSGASPMRIQKGGMALFTQFLRYPFAFLEAVTGKQLTGAQRARLLLGNLAMFGVEGTVGVGLYEMGADRLGLDTQTLKQINDGIYNQIAEWLGVPVDLTDAGPTMLEKPYQMVTEHGLIDIFKQDIPASNAVMMSYDAFKAMQYISDALQPDSDDSKVMEGMMWFAHESHAPTQFRNLVKAAIIMKTGKMYSSKYDILSNKVGPMDAFITAIGGKHTSRKAIEDLYELTRDRDKLYDQAVKDLEQRFKRATAASFDINSLAYKEYKAGSELIYGAVGDIDKRLEMRLRNHMARVIRTSPQPMPRELLKSIYKRMGYDTYVESKIIAGENK